MKRRYDYDTQQGEQIKDIITCTRSYNLALMLGIIFASPTNTVYAEGETQIDTLGVAFRKVEVGYTLDAAFEFENATTKTLKVPAGANFTATLVSVSKNGQGIKLWDNDDASLPWSRVETQFVEQNVAYGVWKDELAATETEFGTKGHYECSACGKYFDKDGGEITELRIAKIGTHNVVINGESKFYAHGESVTVTAEDKEGKVFKGWKDESGNIVSTQKEYTFNVEGEKNLTAVYDDMPSGGGEITPPAKKDGLSGGQIAGIVIGTLLLAGIGGFAIFWFAVKKKTFADLIAAIKALFTKKK